MFSLKTNKPILRGCEFQSNLDAIFPCVFCFTRFPIEMDDPNIFTTHIRNSQVLGLKKHRKIHKALKWMILA